MMSTTRAKGFLALIGALFVFVLVAGCGSSEPSDPSISTDPNLSSQQKLDKAIRLKLGEDTNRDVPKVVSVGYDDSSGITHVVYAMDDNLSNGMTKTGGWIDNADIIKGIRESGVQVNGLVTEGQFAMIDNLGNETGEQTVMKVTFTGDAVSKANLEQLTGSNLESAAQSVDLHPDLQ